MSRYFVRCSGHFASSLGVRCQPVRVWPVTARLLRSVCAALWVMGGTAWAYGDAEPGAQFLEPELQVIPSPAQTSVLALPAGASVTDYEVSPLGNEVALVLSAADRSQRLTFWWIGEANTGRSVAIPSDLTVKSVTWHPRGERLFLLAKVGSGSQILRVDAASPRLDPKPVLQSAATLRRLMVGPRPFVLAGGPTYRLFFGETLEGGRAAVRSVTENGEALYTVIGPAPDAKPLEGRDEPPATIQAKFALPLQFHSAGHALLWEDERHCFHRALYSVDNWKGSTPLPIACGGSALYTANGAGILRWQPKAPGLTLRMAVDGRDTPVLSSYTFTSTPSQMPDGRGVVGLESEGGRVALRFAPLEVPLANVANAWMFLETPRDRTLLSEQRGLFRALKSSEQLYQLYDTEAYACGDHDDTRHVRRPYLVTSDIFWELFAAAFEGSFMLVEHERAMPAFGRFVRLAASELAKARPAARSTRAFAAAVAVLNGPPPADSEAARIVAATDVVRSEALEVMVDYTDFRPRGTYTRDDASKRYFGAVRYLARLPLESKDVAVLRALSPEVAGAAREWIGFYRPFIAPGRSELVWDDGRGRSEASSHGDDKPFSVFPLSWGWDNEALDSTIFHSHWPAAEQVAGPDGPRLIPSGLDLAAIAGNELSLSLLGQQGELARYPVLAGRIATLRKRFEAKAADDSGSLYQRWIRALAVQWSTPGTSGAAHDQTFGGSLWPTKRLQTGLASWATLRHATVLVNDRTEAECGEGGFEPIIMRPPRGYVEPDPASFAAIAGLFEAAMSWLETSRPLAGVGGQGDDLANGIVRRLRESRDKVRLFQAMAEKEVRGTPLSSADYAEILHVGRAAEHNFLIFLSLTKPDFALSNPDPIAKVADVAGGAGTGVLNAAVGAPLEWDQVVPFFGRRQIVKGVAYSFYEFTTSQPIDDETWRQRVDSEPRPGWVQPFMSDAELSCPPKDP